MERYVRIEIPGEPHAQMRSRSTKKGKAHYKDKKQLLAEKHFNLFARQQLAGVEMIEGPIFMVAEYVFSRPKSHYTKVGQVLTKSAPREHIDTPDKSNLDKHIEDCMNKLAYHDDAAINMGISRKRWAADGEDPHTTIILMTYRREFWGEMLRNING